jgi:2-isopropylmalate synthase
LWVSTDLRDGNQALREPMDATKKLCLFSLLTKVGFKEIEAGFPSASKADYDFIRHLIDKKLIPSDVRIGAITQARAPLIRQTMAALRGAKRAFVHLYVGTAPQFRNKVFKKSKEELLADILVHVRLIKELAADAPETEWQLQFCPEAFSQTELPYALQVCEAVMEEWGAKPDNKVVLNLAATVEASTPNRYADQIEWMCRNLRNRESAIVSLHPHNDRGTAVAATELALMAGAERVEGCLLGNGERTGNVDLVTLALNLYSQGVDPMLDLSDLPELVRTVEECTGMETHPRHPYAGELVFTAFAGSHQDAIRKGMAQQDEKGFWDVPYLALDPMDIGRGYENLIRVTSQSGKGGVAYLLERQHGLTLPSEQQIEFSRIVQKTTEETGREVDPEQLWGLYKAWCHGRA